MESFRKDLLEKAVGHALHFCQDNQAQSTDGVIRGLHYQMPPHAQSKLVYVLQGKVKESARMKELSKSLEMALKAARECTDDCAVEWETVEEISDAKEREQAKGN